MTIRNKILLALMIILLSSEFIIISIWYSTSKKLSNMYLDNISESVMLDAYHAFEYLLTDTSYMVTLISTNSSNIVQPVNNLNKNNLLYKNQWNQEYMDNKRVIVDFIRSMNSYKYYIAGITVVANKNCIFSSNHLIKNDTQIYEKIMELNQEKLKTSIVMMNPIHIEGGKSILSSDYVVPAVRGIVDENRNIIGYTVLYFDYGIIEKMFSANLPNGSQFQIINQNKELIFSNCGDYIKNYEKGERTFAYNTFTAESIGWTFTMAIPSEFYISNIKQTVFFTEIVVVVIFFIACIATAVIISKMTKKITELSNSMHRVSEGDLAIRYLPNGEDEIDQMGHTFNHMVLRIDELIEKVTEEEHQKRLNEIAFLQAQINPHFISNVLNNIVWMAKIQHADNIVNLVNSLNSLLQNVMHQEKDMILLEDELAYLDNYITMIEYSGSYDFYVKKDIPENTQKIYILRFILQPIVENAIYHGLPNDLSKQGVINIKTRLDNEELKIIIEDNGDGITKEEINNIMAGTSKDNKSFNSIGIANVNERIKLFYGEEYGLHYKSIVGEYTQVIFSLPIVKEERVCQK